MRQPLSERSYDYIGEPLSPGVLPPGKQLVNRFVSEEIGVSVIPIREAIHRLTIEILVEHVPGFSALLRKTDPQDLDNIDALRDALECSAAREAARYSTDLQLEELDSILNEAQDIAVQIDQQSRSYATKRQINAWLDNEQRFHELLIESARNPLLAKVTHEHGAIIFDPQLLKDEIAAVTCARKKDLLEAFRRRDNEGAQTLMSQHVQLVRKQVLSDLHQSMRS